jgi:adenine-specific DNA glycosylase
VPDYVKRDFPELTKIRNSEYKKIMKEYGGASFNRRVRRVLARVARMIRKKIQR